MNYGMYLSAAGALVEQARQDVIANNLANGNTIGYKQESAVFSERLTEAIERNDFRFEVNPVLERIGGGLFLDEIAFEKENGEFTRSSDNPFHVALQGNGLFAVTDGESTYYTRAGNFQRGPDGSLLTADGKYRVLNVEGKPIRIPENEEGASNIAIDAKGVIRVGRQTIDRLKVVGDLQPGDFIKTGDNMFQARPGVEPAPSPGTCVHQHFLERSSVNPLREMTGLIESYRSYEANLRMLRTQDETLGKTVNIVAKPK